MYKGNNKLFKLSISILICQFAGLIGSFFTRASIASWYAKLIKPSWSPPNWLFAPVWFILYLMMGIALYIVWYHGYRNRRIKSAIHVFGAQLALNVLWPVTFFGLRSPFAGLIIIIILWIHILKTIFKFYPISKPAAYLLLPYILWVSFATALNYSLWQLNSFN